MTIFFYIPLFQNYEQKGSIIINDDFSQKFGAHMFRNIINPKMQVCLYCVTFSVGVLTENFAITVSIYCLKI